VFHLKDGLCFERLADGSVRIVLTDGLAGGGFPPPHGQAKVLFETTVNVDGFASVVASMSARGEDAGTFLDTLRLLLREPSPQPSEVPS
jgi:hypothetical protein